MSDKKKESKIKTTHEVRNLKCKLTPEELTTASEEMAKGLDEIQALEESLESVKKDFKARTTAAEARVNVNKNLVRNKYAYRDVPCELVLNYTKQTATSTRSDTGEVFEERPLSHHEKQMDMGFDGDEKPETA